MSTDLQQLVSFSHLAYISVVKTTRPLIYLRYCCQLLKFVDHTKPSSTVRLRLCFGCLFEKSLPSSFAPWRMAGIKQPLPVSMQSGFEHPTFCKWGNSPKSITPPGRIFSSKYRNQKQLIFQSDLLYFYKYLSVTIIENIVRTRETREWFRSIQWRHQLIC